MKKKDKLSLIRYAVNDYNKKFGLDLKPVYKTKKDIELLLKKYSHSVMCIWSYCCYGLYQNCWQEPIEEGIWGLTQEKVNKQILNVFSPDLLKRCRRESRMFWCKKDGNINLFIVMRDLYGDDFLIGFSNKG